MSNSKTRVTVSIGDRQGELEIVDGNFRIVERGFGVLQSELDPGIYKARARAGNVRAETLFAVEQNAASFEVPIGPLRFASPVPLNETSTSHEYHQGALSAATHNDPIDVGLGQGTAMLLSIRDPSDACFRQLDGSSAMRENYSRSFSGFRLRNERGDLLLDFDQVIRPEPDWGFAVLSLHLQPANYVLSYERNTGECTAMPLPCLLGWQTQVFIHIDMPLGLDAPGQPNLEDRAHMMAPVGIPFYPDDRFFRLAEIARYALVQGRPALPPEQMEEMLQEKFHNPILGLLASHVLLLKRHPPRGLLRVVTDNLAGMIGKDFPDVVALRIALSEMDESEPEFPPQGLSFPPLLRASWEIVTRHPALLAAGSFMRAVASRLIPQGPWLAWKPAAAAEIDLVEMAVKFLHKKAALSPQSMDNLAELMKDFRTTPLASNTSDASSLRLPRAPVDAEVSSAEATLSVQDDASVVLEAITTLARQIPWNEIFMLLKSEAAQYGLLAQLTALQKSLLPTLQLIRGQLEDGEEFTLDDLRQLCEGLNVPLPVLRDSLKDLGTAIIRVGKWKSG